MPNPDTRQRPLSWSSISSFNYNREEWYDRYILGKKSDDSAAMLAGKRIGERLASDQTFLPQVPRYDTYEKELRAKIGEIYLIGFLDSFNSKTKDFLEYKTSSNKKKWTQKSCNEHGQILMYLFLLWKNYGITPEQIKVKLVYIPVKESGDFSINLSGEPAQVFEIKHTTVEVLKFASLIKQTYQEMQEYVTNRLSPTPVLPT